MPNNIPDLIAELTPGDWNLLKLILLKLSGEVEEVET